MADLRLTNSGKIYYGVEPLLVNILCDAFPEAFVRVERSAPQPPAARWVVNKNPYTDLARIVLTKPFGEVVEFPGPQGGTLEQALAAFAKSGFPVPKHIIEEYTQAAARNR